MCEDVWSQVQCKSGITLRSRPKDSTLVAIRFHAFTGVRNCDLRNGCTSVSGSIMNLATVTFSDVAVASGSLALPGPVVARASSSSAMVEVATSRTVRQSALTSTVAGRFLSRTYQANTRTYPSSGVVHVNDGTMHCTPQRTLICGSGFARQMMRRGRSISGKAARISRRNLGDIPAYLLGG